MLRRVIAHGSGSLMLAVMFAINAGCATDGSTRPPCDLENPKAKTYRLKIQTTVENGKVTPTGVKYNGSLENKRHTCPGDIVLWDLKDHEFVIAFDKGTDSPFSWKDVNASKIGNKNWLLPGLIEDKEPKAVELKYSIEIVGGGKYDPIIIVDK